MNYRNQKQQCLAAVATEMKLRQLAAAQCRYNSGMKLQDMETSAAKPRTKGLKADPVRVKIWRGRPGEHGLGCQMQFYFLFLKGGAAAEISKLTR